MDFYAPNVKWIKKQKKIEKKLFDELVENAIKEYGTWEYKLNYVENLLKYNHINEWEYTEKLNALKKKFDSRDDGDVDSDDEVLVVQIDETDTHILVREDGTDKYYVVPKYNGYDAEIVSRWTARHHHHDTVAQAILWFRNRWRED